MTLKSVRKLKSATIFVKSIFFPSDLTNSYSQYSNIYLERIIHYKSTRLAFISVNQTLNFYISLNKEVS